MDRKQTRQTRHCSKFSSLPCLRPHKSRGITDIPPSPERVVSYEHHLPSNFTQSGCSGVQNAYKIPKSQTPCPCLVYPRTRLPRLTHPLTLESPSFSPTAGRLSSRPPPYLLNQWTCPVWLSTPLQPHLPPQEPLVRHPWSTEFHGWDLRHSWST